MVTQSSIPLRIARVVVVGGLISTPETLKLQLASTRNVSTSLSADTQAKILDNTRALDEFVYSVAQVRCPLLASMNETSTSLTFMYVLFAIRWYVHGA